VDLRLDDELRGPLGLEPLGRGDGLLDGVGDLAALDGDAVPGEDLFGLVLVELHADGGWAGGG
jgi:hypothetical protein